MIKKIIVLTDSPFNKRDFDRFGIQILKGNRFEIEIWDITGVLHTIYPSYEKIPENKDYTIRLFTSRSGIIGEISRLDDHCMVNCFIDFGLNTFFLFHALSKRQIQFCFFQGISFPNPIIKRDKRMNLRNIFKRILALRITDIINHTFKKIMVKNFRLFGINAASLVILTGKKSHDAKIYPVNENTKLLWAHALDYDLYLKENNEEFTGETAGGVFLDEYNPFHPDFAYMGMNSPFLPEEYYPQLCAFFSRLEREWGTTITIAAHPRSKYDTLPDFFEGRSVIKGKTIHLVRKSQFVITHMSTALNFAILYNKPLLFVTTDKMQKMDAGKFIPGLYIDAVASELNSTPINLDHTGRLPKEIVLQLDPVAYKNYRSNYIKKEGTPEKPLWEIYSKYLLTDRQEI